MEAVCPAPLAEIKNSNWRRFVPEPLWNRKEKRNRKWRRLELLQTGTGSEGSPSPNLSRALTGCEGGSSSDLFKTRPRTGLGAGSSDDGRSGVKPGAEASRRPSAEPRVEASHLRRGLWHGKEAEGET
ncbi:hypothetical protein CRENBAI_012092 [Crenichthys baileyi]|uniref:Uncharacterized protein n=1 Tax=Crenichthys baileyi TaxID=28760 RepID=A0AAV9SRZ9_9TELE